MRPPARLRSRRFTGFRMLVLVGAFAVATPALAQTAVTSVSFDAAWGLVKRNSPAVRAAAHERQASEIAYARAQRLWLPRVYTELRAYSTDDPANSFTSVLNQR